MRVRFAETVQDHVSQFDPGVRFQAAGPMNGKLPGHADANVAGKMRMDGTAYYALDNAMLLALNVTLTIDARLSESRPSAARPGNDRPRRPTGTCPVGRCRRVRRRGDQLLSVEPLAAVAPTDWAACSIS